MLHFWPSLSHHHHRRHHAGSSESLAAAMALAAIEGAKEGQATGLAKQISALPLVFFFRRCWSCSCNSLRFGPKTWQEYFQHLQRTFQLSDTNSKWTPKGVVGVLLSGHITILSKRHHRNIFVRQCANCD